MPHIPVYASPEFEGKSEIGLYGDSIEELDWSTGQILETLRKLKLDQNTLVIYTSDNGPWKLAQNSWEKGNTNRRVGGFAHPLRGYKFSRLEGGMRVPTVMWWPGRIPADKTCREVVASMDLFATCAEISGAELPTDRVIDGKSLIRLLEAKEGAKSPHDTFFYRTAAVRSGKWKLIKGQLYNLEADIGEATNVAEKHPNVVTRLSALLAAHKKDLSENTRPPGGGPKKPRKPKSKK